MTKTGACEEMKLDFRATVHFHPFDPPILDLTRTVNRRCSESELQMYRQNNWRLYEFEKLLI